MENVLARLPRGSRIAVLRLRSLGDCVLTTPALALLNRTRPDLVVAVVVEDAFRGLLEDCPDIEEVLAPRVDAVRRFRPRLCLNLHGGTWSTALTALSKAKWRAGFSHFRYQKVYNLRIPRAQEILGVERKVHTAEHLASAVFWLGAPLQEIPRASLGKPALAASPVVGARQVVLHPGAGAPEKAWPVEGFLAVARYLQDSGMEPLFIGGATDDLNAFRNFRTIKGAPLDGIRRLLSQASLFIGNDSGPAHMAAAFGIPVVVIFGSSDPEIWGPWRTPSEIVTSPGGIGTVAVPQVLEAVARLRERELI